VRSLGWETLSVILGSRRKLVSRFHEAWPPALLLSALAATWQCLQYLGVQRAIVPPPSVVLSTLLDKPQVYVDATQNTLTEIALGFGFGSLIGVVTAVVIVYAPLLGSLLETLLVASQAIPVIALAPLLVIVLGFGITPRIIIVILAVFFPIALQTSAGLRAADENQVALMRSMGANRRTILRAIELPTSLPFVFAGVQLGLTYSVIGAVVAEWVGTGGGLGKLMILRQSSFGTEVAYAAVMMIIVVALVLLGALQVVKRVAMPWDGRGSAHA
jgi:ABC-type nitrate/sulfonate/bicarbonate transport system permease component